MQITSFLRRFGVLVVAFTLAGPLPVFSAPRKAQAVQTIYDNQSVITERELLSFLELLPQFRVWAHAQHEEAHPELSQGKPDFLYSKRAEQWISQKGWEPRRFFCIMGKMAAALVIVEEGNDLNGTRPPDMPRVRDAEIELARRHLGKLLEAGGAAAPKVVVDAPTLPRKQ